MSKQKNINPRTAREPSPDEQKYVIADGAPKHYVDGYGLVGPAAIVSLAPGVTPGRWMVEVSESDVAKAMESDDAARRLAVLAAAKIKGNRNEKDVQRKEAADEAAREAAQKEAEAEAKREADAMKKAAEQEKAEQEKAGGKSGK